MGLDEIAPFNPNERIIEYLIEEKSKKKLLNLSLEDFSDLTASESTAPGGGSVAAYLGSMGSALGVMVANISAHKPGWDDKWEIFSSWAEKGRKLINQLNVLVDEDTISFQNLSLALSLPKGTKEETMKRNEAIQVATKRSIEVPFQVMQISFLSLEVLKEMAIIGNSNCISDVGVGALCARAAVLGAFFNVKINLSGITDKEYVTSILEKGKEIESNTLMREVEILNIVNEKIKIC